MKKYLILGTLAVGIVIGASALSALAQSGWQPPQLPPPNGNVPGPINSGSLWQFRLGNLTIGTTTMITPNTPGLDVRNGALIDNLGVWNSFILSPNSSNNPEGGSTLGKVLTASDANGTMVWKAPASGNTTHGIIAYNTPGTYSGTIPAGVNYITVELAGGAGNWSSTYQGGSGGYAKGVYSVSPGSAYSIVVGGAHQDTTLKINGTSIIWATGGGNSDGGSNGSPGIGHGQQNFDPYTVIEFQTNDQADAGGHYNIAPTRVSSFIVISY
jgi:hypothetical protein